MNLQSRVRYSPEDGKQEHDERICKAEVKAEKAGDEIANRHSAYGGERVPNVRRSKQAENELHGVFGVAETELDHVREPAVNQSTFTRSFIFCTTLTLCIRSTVRIVALSKEIHYQNKVSP